jgi:hypothetical protein
MYDFTLLDLKQFVGDYSKCIEKQLKSFNEIIQDHTYELLPG